MVARKAGKRSARKKTARSSKKTTSKKGPAAKGRKRSPGILQKAKKTLKDVVVGAAAGAARGAVQGAAEAGSKATGIGGPKSDGNQSSNTKQGKRKQ